MILTMIQINMYKTFTYTNMKTYDGEVRLLHFFPKPPDFTLTNRSNLQPLLGPPFQRCFDVSLPHDITNHSVPSFLCRQSETSISPVVSHYATSRGAPPTNCGKSNNVKTIKKNKNKDKQVGIGRQILKWVLTKVSAGVRLSGSNPNFLR